MMYAKVTTMRRRKLKGVKEGSMGRAQGLQGLSHAPAWPIQRLTPKRPPRPLVKHVGPGG